MAIGIAAVAGLVVATGGRTRAAAWQTDQLILAHQTLERAARSPFDSLVSTIDSVATSLGSYTLNRSVSSPGPRLKRVQLITSGLGTVRPLVMTIVVTRPARLP